MKVILCCFGLLLGSGPAFSADTNAEVLESSRKTVSEQGKQLQKLDESAQPYSPSSTSVNARTLRRQERALERRQDRRVNRRR